MEYFLQIDKSASMIFGSKEGVKQGSIEYFDTNHPVGLLKLPFNLLGNIEVWNLIKNERNAGDNFVKTVSDASAQLLMETFEKVEQEIFRTGILPSTAVITGISFHGNAVLGIVSQNLRYYVYPGQPRHFALTIGGRHYSYNSDRVSLQNPQKSQQNQKKDQPRPNKKANKNNHQQSKPKDFTETAAAATQLDDDGVDKAFNGNVAPVTSQLTPVDDTTMEAAVMSLELGGSDVDHEIPDDQINFSTDTGLDVPFKEDDVIAVAQKEGDITPVVHGAGDPVTEEPIAQETATA